MVRLLISDKQLKQSLLNLSIMPSKTFLTSFPPGIPTDLQRHVLRGIVDGDGCISIYKLKGYLVSEISITGTVELLEGIKDIFNIDKATFYKNPKKHRRNITTMNIRERNQQYKILKLLYSDCNFYIQRKYEKAQEAMELIYNKQTT